jgi:hypothetical protein
MSKLTEMQKLKYWLDAEISILHIMFAVVVWLLTHGWVVHTLIAIYMVITALYVIVRLGAVVADDKDYLRIPPTK